MILAVMLAAAPLAGHLAMPALAALLLITAWNMSESPVNGANFSGYPDRTASCCW